MAVDSLDPQTGAPHFLDTGAPDLAVDQNAVADFAAQVGTRLIGTTAQRNAYEFAREGLEWYDTTVKAKFLHDGNGWVRQMKTRGGYANTATDAAGDVTVTHGMGAVPASAIAIGGIGGTLPGQRTFATHSYTATTFKARAYRLDSPADALRSNPVDFYWQATV